MNIPENFTRVEQQLPEHKREVKLLISCSKNPNEPITTVGWLLNADQNKWYIEGHQGPCFKVLAWAPFDIPTANFSTETL